VFAIIAYVAYNFTITPPLDSITTFTGIFTLIFGMLRVVTSEHKKLEFIVHRLF